MKNNEKIVFDRFYNEMIIDGKLMYIGRLLQKAAFKFQDRPALIFNERVISYKELYIRASILSDKIRQMGVKPQDRVLLFYGNAPEFYIAYYAIWQAGAVVVPLNTFLKESELVHIVVDSRPSLIIVDEIHASLFQNLPTSIPPFITGKDFSLHNDILLDFPDDQIVDLGLSDEMVALLYTSGTTGVAKGVMLSSKNILTNICQGVARFGITQHERVLGVLPFFHSFSQVACIWMSIFVGATVIIVPRIDRNSVMRNLAHKPTLLIGIPAFFGLLCMLKNANLDSVNYCVSGGDALPDRIRMVFGLVYRRKICNGYGLTETSPVISVEMEDVLEPTNTVGRPLFGIQCSIRDDRNNELPLGSVGQLWVRADNVMLGYYNQPLETEKVIVEGWLNTGDKAYMTLNGKLVITGREKDLIINKGFNIYPQEIENIILTHPNVLRVGVVGKCDDEVGEYPVAFVQLKTDTKNSEQELKKLCMNSIASYKVPRLFICSIQELPMTSTGKIDKKVLRQKLKDMNT